jgi:uncharacterized protein YfbU (UPF0304 family)
MELIQEKINTFVTYQNKENNTILDVIKYYNGIHYEYSKQKNKKNNKNEYFKDLQ